MTPEEKQLLLKDLCARLPYGVKMKYKHGDDVLTLRHINTFYTDVDGFPCLMRMVEYPTIDFDLNEIKSYIRPMSSMTEEEKISYRKTQWVYQADYCDPEYFDGLESYDWLNAHHFDYRGLIEKGLALKAPDGMYKTE